MSKYLDMLDNKNNLDNAAGAEELGFTDYVVDAFKAVPRGIERGLVKAPYNLANELGTWVKRKVTGNDETTLFPAYENNFLGESATGVGSALEHLTSFASMFIPVAGLAGATAKGTSFINRLTHGSEGVRRAAGVIKKGGIGTGIIADTITYEKSLGTLTDMFADMGYSSELTSFLETDRDDPKLQDRLKSALEGALLGAGVNAATELVTPLFKMMAKSRAVNNIIRKGGSEEEIAKVLARDDLSAGEKTLMQDFLKRTQEEAATASSLLSKNAKLKETTSTLKDLGFEVSNKDILEISKVNYENIVQANKRMSNFFTDFKETASRDSLMGTLDEMVKLTEAASYQGRSLQALKGQASARSIAQESDKVAAMKGTIEKLKGRTAEELKDFTAMVQSMDTPNELRKFLNNTLPVMSDSAIVKGGKMLQEFWRNSLLSGLGTHALNIGSNAFMLGYDKFKMFSTGLFAGDTKLMRQAGTEFRSLFSHGFQASKLAFKALKGNLTQSQSKGIIDVASQALTDTASDSRFLRSWSREYLGDNAFGIAAEYMGKIVNAPMAFIGGMDEGFKQLAVRSRIDGKLFAEALDKGLSGEQIEQYMKSNFSKYISEEGTLNNTANLYKRGLKEAKEKGIESSAERVRHAEDFVEANALRNADAESEELIQYARRMTFQQDLEGKWKTVHNWVAQNQLAAGWFLPFVKTPMNVLRTAVTEFVPLGHVFDKARGELFSTDARIKAEATARFATATTLTGTALALVNDGVLTGAGPRDANQRRLLEETGWQPYSIKIGDNYLSYRRMDPIATTIGLVSDMVENYNNGLIENADGGKLIDALILSTMENITSKSYLQGISQMFKYASNLTNPDVDSEPIMAQFLQGFVPAIISNSRSMLSQDDPVVQLRHAFDGILARLGFDETLETKRNFLGEELKAAERSDPFVRSLAPTALRRQKEDRVMDEAAKNGMNLGQPNYRMNGVDLREIAMDDGRSAYSHFLDAVKDVKISGRNMRAALTSLVDSKRYQSLPEGDTKLEGEDTARGTLIKSVVNRYRTAAKNDFLKKNPTIARQIENRNIARGEIRKGNVTVRNAIQSLIEKG